MPLACFENEPAQSHTIIFQHIMFLYFIKTENYVSSNSIVRRRDPRHVVDMLPGKSVFMFLINSNVPTHRHNLHI